MILFLDIDGVLHPVSGSAPFRPECLSVLEAIIGEAPGMEIVITSSWREEKSLSELKALLGPRIGPYVFGTTPVIDEPFLHHVRFHEVQAYLAANTKESTKWIAIDDERGNYPPEAPAWITDRRVGLTQNDGLMIQKMIRKVLIDMEENKT